MIGSKDALLLRRIVSGEITNRMDEELTSEERERIGLFYELGYIYLSLDGLFDVQPSAQDVLDEYD